MHDVQRVVEVGQGVQQLEHDAFDLGDPEGRALGRVYDARQVVLRVLHDEVHVVGALSHGDLQEAHDVTVPGGGGEYRYLAEGAVREALVLGARERLLHLEALQRDDGARVPVPRPVHGAVRPRADSLEHLERIEHASNPFHGCINFFSFF